MPEKIKIISKLLDTTFIFTGSWIKGLDYSTIVSCSNCHAILLSPIYIHIIKKLKFSGLLAKDYKPICCMCWGD